MIKLNNTFTEKRILYSMLIMSIIIFIWSAINPFGYREWFLISLTPLVYGLPFVFTIKKFKFTMLAYILLFIHITILLVGAKYTYSLNPLFNDIKEFFDSTRNQFDRVGHFAQGFVPALLLKEFLLRKNYLKRSKFFYLIVITFILGVSAFYEIIEFTTGAISGDPNYILSPQGDPWDTQWDMILALIGAVSSLIIFGKYHDKKMKDLDP